MCWTPPYARKHKQDMSLPPSNWIDKIFIFELPAYMSITIKHQIKLIMQ